MRITPDLFNRQGINSFYSCFKSLYGDFIPSEEINNILENNEFVTAAYTNDLNGLQTIDIPNQDISDYFIAYKSNNTLKKRFKFKLIRPGGEIHNIIDVIENINDLDNNEIFCESFYFSILTSVDNEIDKKYLVKLAQSDNISEESNILVEFLETIIKKDDLRRKRAILLLNHFGFNVDDYIHPI